MPDRSLKSVIDRRLVSVFFIVLFCSSLLIKATHSLFIHHDHSCHVHHHHPDKSLDQHREAWGKHIVSKEHKGCIICDFEFFQLIENEILQFVGKPTDLFVFNHFFTQENYTFRSNYNFFLRAPPSLLYT